MVWENLEKTFENAGDQPLETSMIAEIVRLQDYSKLIMSHYDKNYAIMINYELTISLFNVLF